MSNNDDKDNNFEFIKEQVLENKHRKIRKWIVPFFMTIAMAIIFGLVAAVTICIAEPRLYQILHRNSDNKTRVTFPTNAPTEPDGVTPVDDSKDSSEEDNDTGEADNSEDISKNEDSLENHDQPDKEVTPEPVIVEQKIEANIEDYIDMYNELKTVAYYANKSLVTITSTINREDLFGSPVSKEIVATGIIVGNNNKELLVLTSLDRVLDADSIKIRLSNNTAIAAKLHDYEADINLAVLAIDLKEIPSISMNEIKIATLGESYYISIGTPIIALGNPNGYPFSMEVGIITNRNNVISITDNQLDLFNTDITDNENSDGVIINMKGEIIGVITHTLKEGPNEKINTNIGISEIKEIIERMANQTPRIYCGVKTWDLSAEAKKQYNISYGIYVNEVEANSPAFKAGLKIGDIILKVNDHIISNTNNFNSVIKDFEPQTEVVINIKRTTAASEKEMELTVKLEEKAK